MIRYLTMRLRGFHRVSTGRYCWRWMMYQPRGRCYPYTETERCVTDCACIRLDGEAWIRRRGKRLEVRVSRWE